MWITFYHALMDCTIGLLNHFLGMCSFNGNYGLYTVSCTAAEVDCVQTAQVHDRHACTCNES